MTRSTLWLLAALVLAWAAPAQAQDVTTLLAPDGSLAARTVQLLLLVTVLSLVPGIAIMVTCFPFIVTVLAILRQAIGLQQSPPNMLIVALAMFLTYFVMEPIFAQSWEAGVAPFMNGDLSATEAFPRVMAPLAGFMEARVNPDTLAELTALRPTPQTDGASPALAVLVPAFMLSEMERAFQIGFIIFLPFLIIDLVVAAVLMSMGMMMVPPAIVSLPFKLAFFVVADGWSLIAASLVRGYGT